MKFCFKPQKKSAKETHEMLKLVCGDAAVTMKKVYKWFERFRNGCESAEYEADDGGTRGTNLALTRLMFKSVVKCFERNHKRCSDPPKYP